MANIIKTTSNLIMASAPEKQSGNQYARRPAGFARSARWRTALSGAAVLAVVLPLFISLGIWQWNKSQAAVATQAELDARNRYEPLPMPTTPVDARALKFRRVILRGRFDAAHQILIDNRVYQERAGYHVITPLNLEGSDMHVLVNRGWIPASAKHSDIPSASVPDGPVELSGIIVPPPTRFYNLQPQPTSGWSPVWQNLDLKRFRNSVAYPVQDLIVELDANAPGGFVRDWPRPDAWADRHFSYALQWFGFAVASIGIWAYFVIRRT